MNESAIRSQLKELFSGNPVECRFHLGGLLFFQISSKYKNVQFRQYTIPQKSVRMYPTKFGVSTSLSEYFYFIQLDDHFISLIPSMSTISPCYLDRNHSTSCVECFPMKTINGGIPGWDELEREFFQPSEHNIGNHVSYRKSPAPVRHM